MTSADPSQILAKAGLWAAALRERGQVDDAAAAHLTETLSASFGERLDQQDDPLLVVMLCGPTAVGKSSLINALAGADISRPGLGATTEAAVLYVHERDDPARLFAYSHLLGGSAQQETALVRHCRDELLHKILVDTPDIDSVRLRHQELTTRLVHAADLVLFVTSLEKYKVMRSARWILDQRQQRAMAFVLNKWDREALGLQRARRHEVVEDFRHVLTGEGFPDAFIFKVSALAAPDDGQGLADVENELPALRAWLETGLSHSTASMVRQRRLRAAWGRLVAAIGPVVPRPLSGHPLLLEVIERLDRRGGAAEQSVSAEAAVLALPVGLEDSGWPATPGLLGMWARTRHRIASTTASWRTGLSMLSGIRQAGTLDGGGLPPLSGGAFGAASAAMLSDAAGQVIKDASVARLALGPVGAVWIAEISRLERQLALVPLESTADLVAAVDRPTPRRLAGVASIYAVEGLIALVLVTAVGRIGLDFVTGNYAPAGLFVTVLELILLLIIIGHTIASLFFPPLRQRIRRAVAQHARSLVKAAVQRAQNVLRDQVDAVDRLAQEGRELLLLIDRTVMGLATETGDGTSVDRLFGQPPPLGLDREALSPDQDAAQPLAVASDGEGPMRRRPSFD
jgi:energy-coupling factor transporter ATP-binding protein EcfA2